jgi:hypothetical protein
MLRHVVRQAHEEALLPAAELCAAWADEPGTWDGLLTIPPGPRLTIVWRAAALGSLDLLPSMLGDEFDGSYTVFMSEEDDFRKKDKALVPGLAALRDSRHGQIVRCCAPSSDEDQAALVASWWPGAGRNVAAMLLSSCGGSLTQAWHAADKAARAGITPLGKMVPVVCTSQPGDDFANVLMAGDRGSAMDTARGMVHGDAGGVIALLAARLQLLPLVREAALRGEDAQDTVRRLKADPWVLRQLRAVAGEYPASRVAHCRELLATAETAWRSGAQEGVLEAIAALW